MRTASILRQRILELRRRGKSYNEIADTLGIYKSRISYLVGKDLSSIAMKERLTAQNIIRSRKRIRSLVRKARETMRKSDKSARNEARISFPRLVSNPLFTAGIMLYWGEGDNKSRNHLRITNTDPRMIALYVQFLKKILCVPKNKIHVGLILYPDLKDRRCRKFWSGITRLPESRFMESQYIQGYHPTRRLSWGICMIVVGNTRQKIKVMEWIDLFQKQFKMG